MPTSLDRAVWNVSSGRPFVFLSLAVLFLLASCATPPQNPSLHQCHQDSHIRQGMDLVPLHWNWESLGEGIAYTSHSATQAPLRWHLVCIDLHNPQLDIMAYPDQDEITSTGTFPGKTSSRFLHETGAVVAVNATPFKAPLTQLLPPRQLLGLYINQKKLLSTPVPRYSAICFFRQHKKLRASILQNQDTCPSDADFAFGGFFTILKDGQPQAFPACSLDSRLALGLTEDGRHLIILYAEGEDRTESLGLTYEESALVMREAGAWNALQMDGGASASLSVQNRDIAGRRQLRGANILAFVMSFQ